MNNNENHNPEVVAPLDHPVFQRMAASMKAKPFTPEEREVMDLLVKAHNIFVGLPKTHPDEHREWCDGVHALQNVLGWRVLRRDYPSTFK